MNHSHNTAIQLVYLVDGITPVLAAHHKADQHTDHPIKASGGHIGMVNDLLPFAEIVATYQADADLKGAEYPGVFEYEVTEQLGGWLADHWVSFGDQLFVLFAAELERLGTEFFLQSA